MSLVSVVIPSRNEEGNIVGTVNGIRKKFEEKHINFEIIVINDGSTDNTVSLIQKINRADSRVKCVDNPKPHGIGNAVRKGLEVYEGDYVIIAMADASDDPEDMIRYIEEVKKGYDCCFGTRWQRGAKVENYPKIKYFLNRLANVVISLFFGIRYRDVTNAFKCYSRETINGIKPILSHHFNVTIELPLKAISRGYSYAVIGTNWRARKKGKTSLKIKEMGSRYLFIMFYIWLEKMLSRGDYKKR